MYNYENEKNFTRREGNDKMNNTRPYPRMSAHIPKRVSEQTPASKPAPAPISAPKLNQQQKNNIESAYNARKGGYITEKQFRTNHAKNGVRIPKEKLEQKRLEALTGQWDLKKVNQEDLDKHIRLKNKTPDNYYSEQLDDKELKKRLDEVFGPKTDFSIFNYENNYDKFNMDEKEMFTRKMQSALNDKGYTDKHGFKLKPDGVLGKKTKSVYDAYKRDNPEDYNDVLNFKEENYSEMIKKLDNKIGKSGMIETQINTFSGQQNQDNIETVAFKNSEDKSLREWLYEEKYEKEKKEYITKLEDMVKGIAGYMKNNIPFNAVISKDEQKLIWEAGADLYLEKNGNHISAWMLKHSLKDNPEKVVRGNDSYVANKIQENNEYQRALDDKIKSSENGIINGTLENVDLSGDQDLYFSINKAKIVVDGYREENGDWIIKTTVTDTYDFTEILLIEKNMSAKKLMGTLANNVAYVSQIMGAITPFEVEITFYTRRKGNEII